MCKHLSAMLLAVATVPAFAQVGEPKPSGDANKRVEEAKQRLEFMMDSLLQYAVEIDRGDGPETARLLPTPALRWSNLVSTTPDGVVGVWTRGGRPEVVVQFSKPKSWCYEFCSTSLRPLAMSRNEKVVWSPKVAGITLAPVPKAQSPADSPSRRLAQMRQIAQRFEIEDDFHPIYSEPKIERHILRLLPQPLYRYSPEGDLVDGALFGFVISTDPEALLMVEAYKTASGTEWRYALARMTVYALLAKLDGAEVWSVPEKRAGQWTIDEPYFVGIFR